MDVYRYKAVNDVGDIVRGRLDATNPVDLEMRLTRMGLDLIHFRELGSSGKYTGGRRVQRSDLIMFCFHLEHLVRAGVPILQALADLRDSIDNKRLKETTGAMMESIEGGKTLSGAMADFPSVFSPVFVALIRAGETSGRLSEVMVKITENLKWQDEQATQTKKLLMYPIFVGVVVFAVLGFLMLAVVPQMVSFIANMGQDLPLHTQVLIATSDFIVGYWQWILFVPLAGIIWAIIAVKRNPRARRFVDGLVLRLPVVGQIVRKIILTRFSNFFSIMYASGISVLDCIRAGEDIVGNSVIREAVHSAGRQIADGGGISASFAQTGLFPPLVIRMLRVGENTGALEEALDNVGYFYTRDVHDSIDRMQSMIVPALTVVLGFFLLWIIVSVFGPIYDLFTQIRV